MIARVRGTTIARSPERLVIEVGGVGLELNVTGRVAQSAAIDAEITVHTVLVVREDSLTLFGFMDEVERGLFQLLQTVTGVGPKLALTALSTLSPDQIQRAVAEDDVATLMSVSGIGRKSAQRIIVDLKDKLGVPAASPGVAGTAAAAWQPQVRAALLGLGWSAAEADTAVSGIAEQGVDLSVPEALRLALRSLDRGDGGHR